MEIMPLHSSLGDRARLCLKEKKRDKIKIISSAFSDHSDMKLELIGGNVTNMWKLNNMLLSSPVDQRKIKREI